MKKEKFPRASWRKHLTEASPCDNCPLADECNERRAACVMFLKFVEKSDTPKSFRKISQRRQPTPEVYNYIFCGMDKLDTGRVDVRGLPIFKDAPEVIGLRRAALRSLGVSV